MTSSSELERYLAELEAHLRISASARHIVVFELRAHVNDAVAAGEDEDEAVRCLGSPVELAALFDAAYDARGPGRLRPLAGVAAVAVALVVGLTARSPSTRPQLVDNPPVVASLVVIDPRERGILYVGTLPGAGAPTMIARSIVAQPRAEDD